MALVGHYTRRMNERYEKVRSLERLKQAVDVAGGQIEKSTTKSTTNIAVNRV